MPAHRKPKYDNATELYDSGMSIQDCADFYGVTRQAMHAALKVRKCQFRSNLKHGTDNHFHRTGNGRQEGGRKANHLVEKAVKKGVLIQKVRCEECNKTKTFSDGRTGVHAHHDDYNKPLKVRWLCQKCHHEWHKENTAIGLEVK